MSVLKDLESIPCITNENHDILNSTRAVQLPDMFRKEGFLSEGKWGW